MNRKPGETAEQWMARAAAKYEEAVEALEVESKRLGLDGWRLPTGTHPVLDEGYVGAMDDLDSADDERAEALNALNALNALERDGPATCPG